MTISVVIPAYNEEKTIAGTLDSFMEQKEKADEIIIVNNNSTDSTEDVVKQYPVRLLKESQEGVIKARNSGFDHATSDIIARTDADTKVPLDWIKRIKSDFEHNDIDAVTGPISYYDTPIKTPFFSKMFYSVAEHIFHFHIMIGPNMALKKAMWEKVKNSVCTDPTQVHEDIDLGIHVAQHGGKIMIDNDLVVQSSGRRIIHNPQSFFIEYTQRLMKMQHSHAGL